MSRFELGRKVTVRLDDRLCEKLQDFADHERVPVSSVLRHLVIRFLESNPASKSPFLGPSRSTRSKGSQVVTRAEKLEAEFRQQICSLFDGFLAQGCDAKAAAKATNSALKEQSHPWATHDAVTGVLRKAGRFRKAKGVRA